MPEPIRIDGLLAKRETSYGVDAVPVVGTDGVRISRRLWSVLTVDYAWENLRSDVATGTIIPPKPALPRGRRIRADIFWEVKGAGSDAVPETSPLYRAAGFTETDGTALFDYTQASVSHDSATLYIYSSGLLFPCVGCRGRFRWPWVVGEIAVHQFTMFGWLGAEPSTVATPAVTYDSSEPIAGVASGVTIGAWSPDWLTGEFDPQGVDPQQLNSGNATDGIREFDYGEVQPLFTLTARKVALATYDPYADLKARTTRALAATWGTAQFNRVKLTSTNICPRTIQHADSEGFANWTIGYFVEQWTLRFD